MKSTGKAIVPIVLFSVMFPPLAFACDRDASTNIPPPKIEEVSARSDRIFTGKVLSVVVVENDIAPLRFRMAVKAWDKGLEGKVADVYDEPSKSRCGPRPGSISDDKATWRVFAKKENEKLRLIWAEKLE